MKEKFLVSFLKLNNIFSSEKILKIANIIFFYIHAPLVFYFYNNDKKKEANLNY